MRRMHTLYASLLLMLAIVGCTDLTEILGPDRREHEPDVVYDPTPPAVVDAMLDLAAVKPGDRLYDLGSGDGRIVIAAAKRYGVHGVGLEVDAALIEQANENAAREGVEALVEFRKEDIFTADFHDATVVTLFLGTELNLKLKPRLLTSLAPGARVVSHEYDMGLWKPEVTRFIRGHRLYLWTVPRRAEAPAVAPSAAQEQPAAGG
jgi:SAM-dependent methyltransferase